jgi:hypothetical protein
VGSVLPSAFALLEAELIPVKNPEVLCLGWKGPGSSQSFFAFHSPGV